jgi:uncharacterized protein YodC (DUF2158 family)
MSTISNTGLVGSGTVTLGGNNCYVTTTVRELFTAGDVVKLKSGGPKMTISEFVSQCGVKCLWFDHGQVMSAVFSTASLRRTDG